MTFRMKTVLSHLTQFPQQHPDITNLAGIAGVSEATFKRHFKELSGVGLSTFMRIFRLRRAAWQLAFRHTMSVLDIALEAGFASPEGFNRAFYRCCGISPIAFRQKPDWAYWQSAESILNLLHSTNKHNSPEISEENFKALPLALKIHQGPPSAIAESVSQFIQWRKEYGSAPGFSRTFSIYYDDPATTAPEHWRLGIASSHRQTVRLNPWQVHNATIPELTVAACRITGDEREIGRMLRLMLSQYADRLDTHTHPPFVERHTLFPDVAAHEAQQTLYLPIMKTV
ncbi:AraC family transcriptional regulator [Salinimonas lutimaris]|uniref:AraC family transcriptional regulator n=1 Tax=Salinimonas lutimaris TaxID=914153 RepID=UPI0010C01A5B|nr:helix-turn-helix domain-containing protein [Salinimonas lutimaris]